MKLRYNNNNNNNNNDNDNNNDNNNENNNNMILTRVVENRLACCRSEVFENHVTTGERNCKM